MTEGHNIERRCFDRGSAGRNALWIVSTALIYFATARFSLSFLFQPGGIASIWLPAGIFLSAILLTRRDLRPWLVGVLFMTDLMAQRLAGTPWPVSAIYALALAGDAALSAWLLLRFAGEPITFSRVREVVGFLAFAVVLSNAVWSTVAAAGSQWLGATTFADFWKWWAASNGVGSLLVTPFVLSWAALAKTGLGIRNLRRVLECAALFVLLALLNGAAFSYLSDHGVFSLLHAYITIPFLLWAALRFGTRGVTSALLILAAIALSFAVAGRDTAFSPVASHWNALILAQLYLALLAVPSLLLAADVSERKRDQEALQRSEEMFRRTFDSSPAGAVVAGLDYRFIRCNEAFCRFLGYTEAELLCRTFPAVTLPEDQEIGQPEMRAMAAGSPDPAQVTKRYLRKDGTVVWADVRVSLVRDARRQPQFFLAIIQDITERKRAEEKLRARERLLSESQRIAHIGSWGWDLEGPVEWTDETYRLYGVSPETFIPTIESIVGLLQPEDRPAMQRWIEACGAGQAPGELEFRVILADRSARFLSGRGEVRYDTANRPAYMAGTVQDITERKRAEAAQREARRLLRAVLDTVPVRVFWKDREGRYLGCNLPFARDARLGSPDDLIGKNDFDMTWRELGDAYRADDRWVMETGLPKIGYEEPQKTPTGDRIWLRTSKVPLKDAAGKIIGILGTYEDITERKQAEELLQSQAKHLEKLVQERTAELQENISELEATSYTIAHDMRAPLRAILGYTQMLQWQCPDQGGEASAQYFSRIIDAARRMDRLIQDVLALTRVTRSQLRLEPVDVDKVLQGILHSYPAFQSPQVQIQVQGPLPTVLANEAALTQCISNLLGNAVKFVAPGITPCIKISAEQLNASGSAGEPASPGLYPSPRPSVRLWFADNGIGIALDQHERIFEIFQRVDHSYEGTGIGLAIVRKAMQRMGGKIGLESELGKGSRFWLEFSQPNGEQEGSIK